MIFKKKNKDIPQASNPKLEKYLDKSKSFDTTKINIDTFDLDKSESEMIRSKYKDLSKVELKEILNNANLSQIEIDIIKEKLNE